MTGVQLGAGAYSSVEQVEIKGTKYAAKEVHGEDLHEQQFYKKFFSELHLLFRLSHSNVVQYRLGVCFLPDSKYPALVVEQLQTSLHDYLFHSHTDLFADH